MARHSSRPPASLADMPVRTMSSNDENTDPSDPLYTRFKAWRHLVENLIEYFEYSESMLKSQSKEFTKLSKTLEVPFKTSDFAPDGVGIIWQGLDDKANQMSAFHGEQANIMKDGVLRDLNQLREDIKDHLKEVKEGQNGSKKVGKDIDKFSDVAQTLGKWIPVAETNPNSLEPAHDPYVLWRHVRHSLYNVVDEQNSLAQKLLALQERCQLFERTIVQRIQKAIKDALDMRIKESNYAVTVAQELNGIATSVPPEKEWKYFESREPSLLKSDQKPRDPATVEFPFSNHATTQPILEDNLDRKSTLLKRTQSAYYVLTPSGFLHEYKDSNPIENPEPSLSLKLADCELSDLHSKTGKNGFSIKGKDAGKKFGGMTHDYPFRFDSLDKANKWYKGISQFVAGGTGIAALGSKTTTAASVDSSAAKTRTSEPTAATTGQQVGTNLAQKTGPTSATGSTEYTAAPTTAPLTTAAHQTTAPTTAVPGTAPPTTAPATTAQANLAPTTTAPKML